MLTDWHGATCATQDVRHLLTYEERAFSPPTFH